MKKIFKGFTAAVLSTAMMCSVCAAGSVIGASAEEELPIAAADTLNGAEQPTEAIQTATEAVTEAIEAATEAATEAPTEAPTEAQTEAPTEAVPALDIQTIAGKWLYQLADGDTVDIGTKPNGSVEIKADGTYSYTDANGNVSNGSVQIKTEVIGGNPLTFVGFYTGETLNFGGYYRADTNRITIGNGGQAQLVRDNGTAAVTTAAPQTTATKAATTTKAAAKTTAKATTKAAAKSGSPKTGDAFPAAAVTLTALAAAVVGIVSRKKN